MSPDTRRQFVAFLTAVLAHVLAPAAWGQSPRFAALFTDGTYLREGRLTDGHDPAAAEN